MHFRFYINLILLNRCLIIWMNFSINRPATDTVNISCLQPFKLVKMYSQTILKGAIVALCLIALIGGAIGETTEEYNTEYNPNNEITKLGAKQFFGCKNGLCWTTCIGAIPWWGMERCYSTRGHSQSYDFVKCTSDSQCKEGWLCGGPCTAFSV